MLNLARFLNSFYQGRQNFKASVLNIISFLSVKIYLFFLIFFNIINWLFARYINITIEQEQIALHYSVDFGIDLYGDIERIYIIPALGTIFIVINFFMLMILSKYKNNDIKFNIHLLFLASLVVNIMLLGAIISIYLINF